MIAWAWLLCAHAAQPQWVVESPQIRFVAETEAAERAAVALAPDAERMWLEMGTALGWFPTRPVIVVLGEGQPCHGVCEGAIRLRVHDACRHLWLLGAVAGKLLLCDGALRQGLAPRPDRPPLRPSGPIVKVRPQEQVVPLRV